MTRPGCAFCERGHDGSYWWAGYCSRECRCAHEQGEIAVAIADGPPRRPAQLVRTVAPSEPAAILNGLKPPERPSNLSVHRFSTPAPKKPRYARLAEGERRLNEQGYVTVRKGGQLVAEHRVIMERTLGRPLRKGESVHHRNGIRHDNRPENLELWLTGVRYGQRASELHCPSCGTSYAVAIGLLPEPDEGPP